MIRNLSFVLIALLFSSVAFGANAQVNNVILGGGNFNQAINGCIIPASTTPVILMTGIQTNTTGNRLFFTKQATATQIQYQVPASKTFVGCGFYVTTTSAQSHLIAFGYNTGSFTHNSAVGAGDIYYAPSSSINDAALYLSTTGAGTPTWLPYPIVFPASSYPFTRFDGANQVQMVMLGYEI